MLYSGSYFLLFYYIERVLCVYRNSQNSQNRQFSPKYPFLPIFAYFGKIPHFCPFFTYIQKCHILPIFLYLRFLPIFASLQKMPYFYLFSNFLHFLIFCIIDDFLEKCFLVKNRYFFKTGKKV